ncbi:MAG: succinate:quinone oxidoreductase, partial [Gemmatimonadetes bacterium]|nr:succinate:quinone oxidoreductase [Gemmatimonadota bacterium]
MNRSFRSSIGLKTVMAVTGAGLFLFLVAHMLGNLQIFLGPEALNAYAKKLKGLPELLWPARIGLLVIFLAHVGAAARITRENRAARPVRYQVNRAISVGY